MAKLSALLFDLDGTLINTEWPNALAYADAINALGGQITADAVKIHASGRHWRQFLPTLLAIAGLTVDPQRVVYLKRERYANYLHNVQLNQPLIDLIKIAKNHCKLGLVTTASRHTVEAINRVHQLVGLFDCIVTGDDVVNTKPAPDPYVLAASTLGVSVNSCLIFEDSPTGIASAQAFGAQTLQVLFSWDQSNQIV